MDAHPQLAAAVAALCTDGLVPHTSIQAALQFGAVLAAVPSAVALGELIAGMGAYLTHGDGDVRRRGTALLAALLERWDAGFPVADGSLEALTGFFCARLGDYPSVAPCVRGLRALLRAAEARPAAYPAAAARVCRALFTELHVPALDQAQRHAVYSLLLHVLQSPVHGPTVVLAAAPAAAAAAAAAEGDAAAAAAAGLAAAEFGAGLAAAMDGEKDPRCLLVCLQCVRAVLSPAPPLAAGARLPPAVLAELFDVTACYFPISFTPPPNDPHGITRPVLIDALRGVFTASPALAPHVVPLLLEKLGSSITSAKRDAAQTLAACARAYGVPPLAPYLRQLATALKAEAVFPERSAALGGAAAAGGGAGVPASSLLWTALAPARTDCDAPAECSDPPSPVTGSAAASPFPPVSLGTAASSVGVSAGAMGLDFAGPASTHGRSGYGLVPDALEASASSGEAACGGSGGGGGASCGGGDAGSAGGCASSSAPHSHAPPPDAGGDVLEAIAVLTRLLAAHDAAAGGGGEWRDFAGLLVADATSEVERAADSPTGRAAGRLLAALATSCSRGLAAVADAVVPLVAPLYAEATANHRYGVRVSCAALLAGVVHAASPLVDHPPGGHPLSPRADRMAELLADALTAVPASHAAAAGAAGATAAASQGAGGGAQLVSEARCVAAAGLSDLCARTPSPLLGDARHREVAALLTSVALDDPDARVAQAALRALCTVAAVRRRCAAVVVAESVPRLLAASAHGTATGARALLALGQLCCVSNPALSRAIVPSLLERALDDAAPGRVALRGGPVPAACLSVASQAVCLKAAVGDTAGVDELVLGQPSTAAADDASSSAATTTRRAAAGALVPLLMQLAVDAADDDGAVVWTLAQSRETETAVRMATLAASPSVQDALGEAAAALLLALPQAATYHSLQLRHGLPALLAPLAPARLLCAAPTLLAAVVPARKGAPQPHAAGVVRALVATLLASGDGGEEGPHVTSCVAAEQQQPLPYVAVSLAQALGALLNRLPAGPELEGLLREVLGAVARRAGVGSHSLGPLLNAAPASSADAAVTIRPPDAESAADGGANACDDERTSPAAANQLRERGVLALAWVAKGMALRGHPAAVACVRALSHIVARRDVTGAQRCAAEPALVTLASRALGGILADAPRFALLSREAGASVGSGLHKQRLFALVHSQYVALSSEVDDAARTAESCRDSPPSVDDAGSHGSTQRPLSASIPVGSPVAALAATVVHASTASQTDSSADEPPSTPALFGSNTNPLRAGSLSEPSDDSVVSTGTHAADAKLTPLLLALVAMAGHLPRQLLVSDAERVLPLVIRALDVAAGQPPLSPVHAPLRQAVALSALASLTVFTTTSPALVSVHVHHLVSVLLALARFSTLRPTQALLRVTAINCLRAFTTLPYHRLHPVRQIVVAGLVAALDDPKRSVRRRAGAARNEWLTCKA